MRKCNVTILIWVLLTLPFLSAELRLMGCSYGERGSLTVFCTNATAQLFRFTSYTFDYLDETLKCVNCNLQSIDSNTFDISGNRIKTLDIRNSSITKIWPKAFTGLIFMEKLLLSHNPITNIYPGAFVGARKLKYLEVENTAISSLEPETFKELHLLQVLSLRLNTFTEIEHGTFDGLYNLKILDLGFNKLEKINNSLNSLKSLRILNLSGNRLSKINGNDFSELKSLRLLSLANNNMVNFSMEIDATNELRLLNLASNRLSSDGIKSGTFSNLNKLEEIDLSNNILRTIPPKFFQGLFFLRKLNLHGNQIREFSTGSFSSLPYLRVLNISSNSLETAKVSGRLILHSLHTLDLSDNQIKEFNYIDLVTRMPHLTYVNLKKNYLPCETRIEIETLFNEDHVRFIADGAISTEGCDEVPKSIKEILEKYRDRAEAQNTHKAAGISIIVLVTIIIILVAILFYMQFFILNRMR